MGRMRLGKGEGCYDNIYFRYTYWKRSLMETAEYFYAYVCWCTYIVVTLFSIFVVTQHAS